jgi:hypothetical protein
VITGLPTNPRVVMEGFLFKRSTNFAGRVWKRRWFMIVDDTLVFPFPTIN